MKITTGLALLVLSTATALSPPHAQAWPWSKLDLNSIQGNYSLVIKPNMYLGCPDSITVVYNAANATLDSEAFHFSNIGRGSQPIGQDFDPDQAAYSDQSVDTRVNSNSVTQTANNTTTSSDTSQFPLDPGPLDAQPPGSAGSMGLAVSTSAVVTTLKYNSGAHTLTKSVEIGGDNAGEDCTFSKTQ